MGHGARGCGARGSGHRAQGTGHRYEIQEQKEERPGQQAQGAFSYRVRGRLLSPVPRTPCPLDLPQHLTQKTEPTIHIRLIDHQRRSRHSPLKVSCLGVVEDVCAPSQRTGRGVQSAEFAGPAERIEHAVAQCRRRSRPVAAHGARVVGEQKPQQNLERYFLDVTSRHE